MSSVLTYWFLRPILAEGYLSEQFQYFVDVFLKFVLLIIALIRQQQSWYSHSHHSKYCKVFSYSCQLQAHNEVWIDCLLNIDWLNGNNYGFPIYYNYVSHVLITTEGCQASHWLSLKQLLSKYMNHVLWKWYQRQLYWIFI